MFHIVLYQPEIPPNTGNIMRLCANTGARLHLIHPLGFWLDAPKLRRAGMDYRHAVTPLEHPDWASCRDWFATQHPNTRLYALSTHAQHSYADVTYQAHAAFILGPESRGLPLEVMETLPCKQRLRIPMQPESRSLNLANAAAIVLYEAWRQQSFA